MHLRIDPDMSVFAAIPEWVYVTVAVIFLLMTGTVIIYALMQVPRRLEQRRLEKHWLRDPRR